MINYCIHGENSSKTKKLSRSKYYFIITDKRQINTLLEIAE